MFSPAEALCTHGGAMHGLQAIANLLMREEAPSWLDQRVPMTITWSTAPYRVDLCFLTSYSMPMQVA